MQIFVVLLNDHIYDLKVPALQDDLEDVLRARGHLEHIAHKGVAHKGQIPEAELGRLMHDFHCKNADDMYSEVLAGRVRALKETPKGVDSMCRELEQLYLDGKEEGILKGRAEGRAEGILSNIRSLMATLGLSIEAAMSALEIPEGERKMYSVEDVRPVAEGTARLPDDPLDVVDGAALLQHVLPGDKNGVGLRQFVKSRPGVQGVHVQKPAVVPRPHRRGPFAVLLDLPWIVPHPIYQIWR